MAYTAIGSICLAGKVFALLFGFVELACWKTVLFKDHPHSLEQPSMPMTLWEVE